MSTMTSGLSGAIGDEENGFLSAPKAAPNNEGGAVDIDVHAGLTDWNEHARAVPGNSASTQTYKTHDFKNGSPADVFLCPTVAGVSRMLPSQAVAVPVLLSCRERAI